MPRSRMLCSVRVFVFVRLTALRRRSVAAAEEDARTLRATLEVQLAHGRELETSLRECERERFAGKKTPSPPPSSSM